jgi:hypothetical protein
MSEQPSSHPQLEQQLARRPPRRSLTPIPLALLGVLLIACGFIAGVLVEKGEGSTSTASSSGGVASRFATQRSGALSAGGGARGASASSGAGGFGVSARAAAGSGATIGEVAYVAGHSLYVIDAEGNTVKIKTSVSSTVTKTVKASVESIHPGETVIVTGSADTHGAVNATGIRVSEAGAGGLSALFGSGAGSARARRGGGEPTLFGG